MAFRIIADSSCDIFDLDRKIDGLYFNTVPFVITVDGRDFVDDDKLDVKELVEAMAASSKSHTSCPSPADWVREFGEEGDVFALTISSNLSGSYNTHVPPGTWFWKMIRREILRSLIPAVRDRASP